MIHSGSRGFIRAGLGVFAFIRVRVGSLRCARGRQVHSGSRAITRKSLVIVWFIRVRVGSLQST